MEDVHQQAYQRAGFQTKVLAYESAAFEPDSSGDWQRELLSCTYLRRLEGESGRCIDKGGVLPTAGSEKFRVITNILSGDQQRTESECESGKYDTCVCRKPLAGRNGGPMWLPYHCCWYKTTACIPATRNKSTQIKGTAGEVEFANPVSQLFCNITCAQHCGLQAQEMKLKSENHQPVTMWD